MRASITFDDTINATAGDVELLVKDAEGNEAYPGNPDGIPDAFLSAANEEGTGFLLSPQTFTDLRTPSNRQFTYFACHNPIYDTPQIVSVTLSEPGQPDSTFQITMDESDDCFTLVPPPPLEPPPLEPPPLEPPPLEPRAPIAVCDAYWVKEHGHLNIAAPGFLKNDSDPQSLPLSGTVDDINFGVSTHPYTFNGTTGGLKFTPNSTPGHKPFVALLNYHVTNSKGLSSPQVPIKIYIQPHRPSAAELQDCEDRGGGRPHARTKPGVFLKTTLNKPHAFKRDIPNSFDSERRIGGHATAEVNPDYEAVRVVAKLYFRPNPDSEWEFFSKKSAHAGSVIVGDEIRSGTGGRVADAHVSAHCQRGEPYEVKLEGKYFGDDLLGALAAGQEHSWWPFPTKEKVASVTC